MRQITIGKITERRRTRRFSSGEDQAGFWPRTVAILAMRQGRRQSLNLKETALPHQRPARQGPGRGTLPPKTTSPPTDLHEHTQPTNHPPPIPPKNTTTTQPPSPPHSPPPPPSHTSQTPNTPFNTPPPQNKPQQFTPQTPPPPPHTHPPTHPQAPPSPPPHHPPTNPPHHPSPHPSLPPPPPNPPPMAQQGRMGRQARPSSYGRGRPARTVHSVLLSDAATEGAVAALKPHRQGQGPIISHGFSLAYSGQTAWCRRGH